MAKKKGNPNLGDVGVRITPETAREMQRRGAIVRARNKTLRDSLKAKLEESDEEGQTRMDKATDELSKQMADGKLPAIFEIEKEGKAMGHCVFSSRYDERDTSLIFSVRDVKGRRLATVELDLTTMQILQCRAKNNGTPEKDSEIRSLITRNLPRIAEARKLVS